MREDELYFESPYFKTKSEISQNWFVEKGWIELLQDGRVILKNDFMKVMQLFDTIILIWATKDKAIEYLYPDFYCSKDLEKCNYLHQFYPHCVFSSVNADDYFSPDTLKYSGFVNNPAICMHSYIQYQNSIIKEDQPIVITAKGKCKRNEHNGFYSLERLLDFTMREVVFIGTAEYVVQKRNEYMDKARQLVEDLHLDGKIMLSNDPFFKKEDETKVLFQKRFKLKYELLLKNPQSNNEVAVASFNYHNVNFSKSYKIHLADHRLAHTACVAFGLERLAFTYLMQVGVDKCYNTLNEYIMKLTR